MIKKFVHWIIFGSETPEPEPQTEVRYSVRNGRPHKEVVLV
jgi:hypothetical protein